MMQFIALQFAADPSLDTVRQRWRLANRQQKLSSTTVDQATSGKIASREARAELSANLALSPSRTGVCCNPARAHTNTHSTGGTA
jgi:hypothetical protein